MDIVITVFLWSAGGHPVIDPDQEIEVIAGERRLSQKPGSKQYIGFRVRGTLPDQIRLVVKNQHFWDFTGVLDVKKGTAQPGPATESAGLIRLVRDNLQPAQWVVHVILSNLRDVSNDASKIFPPPHLAAVKKGLDRSNRAILQRISPLQYEPRFEPGLEAVRQLDTPGSPLFRQDPDAPLNQKGVPFKGPGGSLYVLERKGDPAKAAQVGGAGETRLIMVWKPPYIDLNPGDNRRVARFGYHVTLHPAASRLPSCTRAVYPFGKDPQHPDFRPYVDLGYRYLFHDFFSLQQHISAARRIIFVVPVGSAHDQFADIASAGGMYQLLKDINLFMFKAGNAGYETYMTQGGVERVALSAFSYAGTYLLQVLDPKQPDLGSKDESVKGPALQFYRDVLREVYNFDCNVSGRDFWNKASHWRGNDQDKMIRIYGVDGDSVFQGAARQVDRSFKMMSLPKGRGRVGEAHKGGISIVIIPTNFFKIYTTKNGRIIGNPRGVELVPKSSNGHHWFPRFFMNHALAHSGFPKA